MIFINSNRKLHLFDNFWMFKTHNTKYNYMYVENYIYKKLKEVVEIYKNQTKNQSVLAKIYKVYIIYTPKYDDFGKFLSFTKHNGMVQAKKLKNVLFFYPPLHSMRIVFAWFGNMVNVPHDYQSIHFGSMS